MTETNAAQPSPAVDKRIDKPIFRGLRASIAAIPIIGGSISVLVESEISKRQAERVEQLLNRIAEIEASLGKTEFHFDPAVEDELLESAVNKAKAATEHFRSRLIANCLFAERDKDPKGIIRRHLIELAGTLTILELAIISSVYSRDMLNDQPSEVMKALHKIDLADGETAEIREYAHQRLTQFLLLEAKSDRLLLTKVGELLAGAIE